MAIQLRCGYHHHQHHYHKPLLTSSFSSKISFSTSLTNKQRVTPRNVYALLFINPTTHRSSTNNRKTTLVNASSNTVSPFWDESWKPDEKTPAPSLSDIFWPSAGAFVAMASLGKMDQMLAPKGISMSIAPLGAVCAVLFATPSSPAARKYNTFVAQIGCAAIGVLAFSLLGPGWLARSSALAVSIAFMLYTRSTHPPAASLPILFIDGAKLHHLNFWYAFFPGATGCILVCLINAMLATVRQISRASF
ncbi:hypothetical protein IFM89_004973 [Coptis chinensis]|uniref:HPP transmembrane region domain-containing protein n=1 Tax=Coptis chinensis TaxID=261450 RepID=A0A835LTG2_9MAGN|nr:hypothetical protein IFM89_004973 [Coptis chinensis]